ncbi:TraB/GumN family protein [Treponema endosymbiont of Eucomonympha sp.]|uniref:TraB/GumN family protein n=1 Tax=Treponema endosymbiont of Eucomonympha sp. TaxID=1580831 RepID=UPI0007865AEF|nr:TraB/GumN family protein [Treponema endosymbiont of Eucomonympha sp.]
MSQTEKRLSLAGRTFVLLGTAHISRESIAEARAAVAAEQPDCAAIELDEQRLALLKNPDSWQNLDVAQALRKGQGFVLMANLVLSSFQRRMGADVGVKPGEDMKAAIQAAEAAGIPAVMVDRPITTTLRRAWARNSLWGKAKLLAALASSAFSKEAVSAADIESLKNSSEMDSLMEELAETLPAVKTVLIDERDRYLASHIWQCGGNKVLAVLGAGHLPGVERHLTALSAGQESADTSELEALPPKTLAGRLAGLLVPALLVALVAAGFVTGGVHATVGLLTRWLLWNGSLAALGTLLAGGHVLAVLTGFVTAPFATLNPFLSVGVFTGFVQAWIRKPKVSDMETLAEDASSLRGFYRNRLLRVLLIFFASSLGGAIGNIIAVPALVSSLLH